MREQAGFTVIELLIALQLGILVIGFAYLSYGFVQQYLQLWQQQRQRESNIAVVTTVITQTLDSFHYVQTADRDALTGFSANGPITLKWRQLSRNGISILPQNTTVVDHRVTYWIFAESSADELVKMESVDNSQLAGVRAVELQLEIQTKAGAQKINIFARLARLRVC